MPGTRGGHESRNGDDGAPGTPAAGGNRPDPGRAARALERAAERAGLTEALTRIRAELSTSDPEVARDLGW
jgi:hypothetical protein